MTRKFFLIPMFAFLFAGLISCNNDDDNSTPSASVNDFIWKAMNYWYYWQTDVPN
ncbi:MAG: carboxyl-terminal protease, partial [Flavobacteriia bacterium]|nr:carboxyl-terminal protease [Flavobacteriia bacterium]